MVACPFEGLVRSDATLQATYVDCRMFHYQRRKTCLWKATKNSLVLNLWYPEMCGVNKERVQIIGRLEWIMACKRTPRLLLPGVQEN